MAWIFTVSEKQNQEDKYRNIERPLRRIDSHQLPSASWRSRKDSGVVPNPKAPGTRGQRCKSHSESRGPENQEMLMCRGRREDIPSSSRGRTSPFLPLLFCSRPSRDWMMPIHTGKGGLIYSVYQLNAHLFQKHPQSHTAMFYQLSGHPQPGQVDTSVNHHTHLHLGSTRCTTKLFLPTVHDEICLSSHFGYWGTRCIFSRTEPSLPHQNLFCGEG